MRIIEVNKKTSTLINQLLEVWENSVRATHLFLSNEEIENIKKYIPQAISDISHLIIAKNDNNTPIAFMGIENEKLEMLFIRNNERGKGLNTRKNKGGIKHVRTQ